MLSFIVNLLQYHILWRQPLEIPPYILRCEECILATGRPSLQFRAENGSGLQTPKATWKLASPDFENLNIFKFIFNQT